jgi:alpha-tubulin suppressor-like RCC1 family protein
MQDAMAPRVVRLGRRALSASAGDFFTAVVTAEGELRMWGTDRWGQLGQEAYGFWAERHSRLPVRVVLEGLQAERISHVACGAEHALALAESGKLFSFGGNVSGPLGRPEVPMGIGNDDACSGVPGEVRHEALQRGITDLQAGGYRSAVALTDGSVLTFGSDLGEADGESTRSPSSRRSGRAAQ